MKRWRKKSASEKESNSVREDKLFTNWLFCLLIELACCTLLDFLLIVFRCSRVCSHLVLYRKKIKTDWEKCWLASTWFAKHMSSAESFSFFFPSLFWGLSLAGHFTYFSLTYFYNKCSFAPLGCCHFKLYQV